MTAASRSLATALSRARFASGLLQPSYTTNRDTTYNEGDGLGRRIPVIPEPTPARALSAFLRHSPQHPSMTALAPKAEAPRKDDWVLTL